MNDYASSQSGLEIAVIGMAGRFPGAKDIEAFWQNLRDGVESIAFFTDQEMEAEGVSADILKNPNYVKAQPMFEGAEDFDADFFGFSPREAEAMDPQHRLFLECVWEALENAGYDSERYKGLIGIYAGVGANTYLINNILPSAGFNWSDYYQLFIGNDKDFLPTRVSYRLNLRGPSVNVQTACSTALVALHLASRALLSGECDMALAGGVSVINNRGYFYQEGGIPSPDGRCRAFDAQARGTIFGSGVGAVVLKRLVDALDDGDYVHAVVKGSAINNDGALKIGYTAPSVEGQSQVIRMAHVISGVDADTVSYVETHGTGTVLGDPIEIRALTQAFRASTQRKGFCAIGSVKTNVGHLDTAAGAAGLIKTIMALKHKMIPPSLHFEEPNPQIDFENSPFYVNTALAEWKTDGISRRAGVSSFGIGGTNAHVILEESPAVGPSGPSRPWQMLMFSAKTDAALEALTLNLAEHLREHPSLSLADVAYTLQLGRRFFTHCRIAICDSLDGAVTALETKDPKRVFTYSETREISARSVVFMFTGQGAQYVNMAAELYQHEPVFQEHVDHCLELLRPHMGLDLGKVLHPREEDIDRVTQVLQQTEVTQPALFVVEYALAQLWMSWGVKPQAMIGHSIGEYVAACLAGVFSVEDALALVAARGRLMQHLPEGAMLAVFASEEEVLALLGPSLSLAAVNGPALCTISGPDEAVEELAHRLTRRGIEFRRLRTSHAFHSEMMDPILDPFVQEVKNVNLRPPEILYISNVSGTWITAAEATAPDYWAQHLRRTVRFADGIGELSKDRECVLLEVGPGKTLIDLARQHPDVVRERLVASLRHPKDEQSDEAFLLRSLGQLWFLGVQIDWPGFYTRERRLRVPLPTYPFERQRYWIEPANSRDADRPRTASRERPGVADWFYIPSWKRTMPPVRENQESSESCWLLLSGGDSLSAKLTEQLLAQGGQVITVLPGEQFADNAADGATYVIHPEQAADYDALAEMLKQRNQVPSDIVHLWSLTPDSTGVSESDALSQTRAAGFYSLLFLMQALTKQGIDQSLRLNVVSNNVQSVTGAEVLRPEKAMILGPCKVIPQEYPYIACRHVDVVLPEPGVPSEAALADRLVAEFAAESPDKIIAYRGRDRWVQTFEKVRLDGADGELRRLRERGVYLITGGLGGIGLTLAEHLARTWHARLVLVGRSVLPAREEWDHWLETHDDQDGTSRKMRKVEALEELGAEVMLAAADVTDHAQMQTVIDQARERFGEINGVVHAAGIAGGGMMQLKTRGVADSVLAPKVEGTFVLYSFLKDVPLDFFVLCSSINAIIGGFGQVDYCAANAFLDAFAREWASGDGTFVVSLNWDRWREVGMAVEAMRSLGMADRPLVHPEAVGHPLLEQRVVKSPEREIFLSEFSVAEHWVLSEHRVARIPTVPGTTYLEMARAALGKRAQDKEIQIRDVLFIVPLAVREGEKRKVLTILEEDGTDYVFRVASRLESDDGMVRWLEHVSGKIGCLEPSSPERHDIGELLREYEEIGSVGSEGSNTRETERLVDTGPRWEVAKRAYRGASEGLALLELPEKFSADLERLEFHPALVDVAVGLVAVVAEGNYLPLTYESVTIKRALPSKIYSHVKFKESEYAGGEIITADIVIMDEHGVELAKVTNFSMRKVNVEASRGLEQGSGILPFESEGSRPTLTAIERFFESLVAGESMPQEDGGFGILNEEGVDAFNRILAWNTLSQIVVTPRDLQAVIDQTADVSTELGVLGDRGVHRPTHARPDVESEYVPPVSEVENEIAEIWRAMLGIERIGIHDNFFELGGTSLVGIQVVSELKKVLGVEVPVISIFEAPTVSLLAKRLRPEEGDEPSFQHTRDRAQMKKEAIRRRQRARRSGQ